MTTRLSVVYTPRFQLGVSGAWRTRIHYSNIISRIFIAHVTTRLSPQEKDKNGICTLLLGTRFSNSANNSASTGYRNKGIGQNRWSLELVLLEKKI